MEHFTKHQYSEGKSGAPSRKILVPPAGLTFEMQGLIRIRDPGSISWSWFLIFFSAPRDLWDEVKNIPGIQESHHRDFPNFEGSI